MSEDDPEDPATPSGDGTDEGDEPDVGDEPGPVGAEDGAGEGATGESEGTTPDVPGADRARSYLGAVRDSLGDSPAFRAVVGITVLSLVVRLVMLGDRTAHWDEGRVAYWVVRYMESGVFEYRPIVHGPFFFQVDRWVFTAIGPSDFAMRLPVAVVGGLLPLAAWLLRDRLRAAEVVALALVLAGNPLLVYYSRFMRNDVLVAGFMVFAFALFVRTLDTGSTAYLYAGTASFALAFTTKENAILYVACWIGALGLLLDHRLFRTGRAAGSADADAGTGGQPAVDGGHARYAIDTDWVPRLEGYVRAVVETGRRWWLPVSIALVEFLVIIVFFFAPRGGGYGGDGIGLWMAFSDPTLFPAVIEEALVGSWQKMYSTWIGPEKDFGLYPDRLRNFLWTLVRTSGVIAGFSVVGFVVDRWSAEGPRDVVSMAFYWGAVSVLGYPYATDIWAPWIAVHAVVPLAIPAAVGIALVYGWGREALEHGDEVGAVVAAILLIVLAVPAGVTAVDVAYLGSDTHERVMADALSEPNDRNQRMLQWAQPGNGLKETMGTVGAVARTNDGVDVLFVGSTNPGSGQNHFYVPDDRVCAQQPPVHSPSDPCTDGDLDWHSRLPLPWYMERHGAVVDSTPPNAGSEALQDAPPVVVAYGWDREEVASALPDRYEANEHRFKLWSENVVVFVDPRAVPG